MEELIAASNSFVSALRRYSTACRAASELFTSSHDVQDTSNLLNFITLELEATDNHEAEVRKIKCMLAQTRNSARTISPMNALPLEILVRIFEIISNSSRCSIVPEGDFDAPGGWFRDPTWLVPDTLSHVCTHWRRVSLGVPSLWSHIDLTNTDNYSPLFRNLLHRGEAFTGRASPQDLTLHISLAGLGDIGSQTSEVASALERFYSLAGPQTKCLELKLWTYNSEFSKLLERSLLHAEPGVLEELILEDRTDNDGGFIGEKYSLVYPDNPALTKIQLTIPAYILCEKLRPVTVLYLRNLFFPWTSPAYSGLTELRLFANQYLAGHIPSITISELAVILRSSPGLCILHFDLPIERAKSSSPDPPVLLQELQELNIKTRGVVRYEILLPIIQPGPKALNLSLSAVPAGKYAANSQSVFHASVLDFSRRSNITRLHLDVPWGDQSEDLSFGSILSELTVSPSGLCTLELYGFGIARELAGNGLTRTNQSWPAKIDRLLVDSSWCHIDTLKELVKVCPIRVFVQGDLRIESDIIDTDDTQMIDRELAGIFPIVRSLHAQSPTDEWDNLGFLDC